VSWAFKGGIFVFSSILQWSFGFAFASFLVSKVEDGEQKRNSEVEQLGLIGLFGVLIWTRLQIFRRTSTSALSLGSSVSAMEH